MTSGIVERGPVAHPQVSAARVNSGTLSLLFFRSLAQKRHPSNRFINILGGILALALLFEQS